MTAGEPLKLMKPRLLPPGKCIGQFVVGMNQGSALNSSPVQAGLTVYWVEEAMPQ